MVEYVAGNAPPPSPLPPGTGAGTGNRTGDLLVPSLWPFVFQPAGLIRCWTGPLQDFLSTKNRSSDSRVGVCHHISTELAFVIIFQEYNLSYGGRRVLEGVRQVLGRGAPGPGKG